MTQEDKRGWLQGLTILGSILFCIVLMSVTFGCKAVDQQDIAVEEPKKVEPHYQIWGYHGSYGRSYYTSPSVEYENNWVTFTAEGQKIKMTGDITVIFVPGNEK